MNVNTSVAMGAAAAEWWEPLVAATLAGDQLPKAGNSNSVNRGKQWA